MDQPQHGFGTLEPDLTAAEPPPPPPQPSSSPPPRQVIYVVDSSRSTFAELWRDTRSPVVIFAWLFKLFRARIPGSVNDPNVEALAPFEVSPASLPADVLGAMEPALREMESLGFTTVAAHEIIDLFNHSTTRVITLTRPDGSAIARVWYRTEGSGNPPKTHFYCDFLTAFADGSFTWSTAARSILNAPPAARVTSRVAAAPHALWEVHQSEVNRYAARSPLQPAVGREQVLELMERHHALCRDFHLQRRVFRPMRPHDLQHADALQMHVSAAASSGMAHPQVWAELVRMQQTRRGWGNAVMLLLVSLLLFIGAGSAWWEWEFVLLLVVLLFFHEMGHFVAMKAFRYRNLRMFFIPLMGAAVSGVNYSAPGWKKVVVALMGPLPGIVLGAVLGVAGIATDNALLIKAAVLALILNGLNLLPVLPLDGGRVVHTLFFARHWTLDIFFRVIAGAGLILGSYAIGDRLLMFLGIFMLIGAPGAYKLARIASDLRRQGLRPALPDERMIPPDVAEQIITRVRQAFPSKMGHKVAAQHTLSVYETINTRTPGWLATIAFATLHFASIAVALVLTSVFIVVQHQGVEGLTRAWTAGIERQNLRAQAPKHVLAVDQIRSSRHLPTPTTAPATIIATHRSAAEAEQTFAALSGNTPLLLFGQTVMLPLAGDSAARDQWFTELENRTGDLFVLSEQSADGMALQCVAPSPDAAKEIAAEAVEYLNIPAQLRLIPPWSPAYDPAQRDDWRRARRTFLALWSAGTGNFDSPQRRELAKRMADMQRRGDVEGVNRLAAEQAEQYQKFLKDERRKLLEPGDPQIDVELARDYITLIERYEAKIASATGSADEPGDFEDSPMAFDAYDELLKSYAEQLGGRMGQIPAGGDGATIDSPDRFSVRDGLTDLAGDTVKLQWIRFVSPVDGAPALARWLAEQGCADFRYEFTFDAGFFDGADSALGSD